MTMSGPYTVKVEEPRLATGNKPSAGPVYRCIYAKGWSARVSGRVGVSLAVLENSVFAGSDTAKRIPNSPLLGRRKLTDEKGGPYIWLSYQEVYETAMRFGSAIRSRGVNPGQRCGIYGSNCPEWIIAMEACTSQAITYVPLYDTLGANAVEFIINHAEVSIAFVQENKIPAILSCLPRCSSNLRTIVSFAKISSTQKKEAEELGGSLDGELPLKKKTDICTIMYTSGTTGEPKGVVLTNEVIMTEVLSIDQLFEITDKGIAYLLIYDFLHYSVQKRIHTSHSFLWPIYMIKQWRTIASTRGCSIGFWQGDVRYLMDDIQELKPTLFCGVPRVYDRIYTGISNKIASGGLLSKKQVELFREGSVHKTKQHLGWTIMSSVRSIRQALGGRLQVMLSGAAPLPRHVEEFLRVTSGTPLTQGYGLTESCGGCFTSLANVFPMMGTVGVPITTIEARLESVPEMGYDALSSVPRGEICLRGTTLFSGYYKRPDITKEVVVDGWFHTGDIGEWQPNGAMKIIDRKKNIFKLSQGEYVAVESIENIYLQCPLIASIWVYGNSFESFLVAVVVPDKKALEDWAANHLPEAVDYKSLCKNLKARKYILDELNSTGQKHKLRGFEMLKVVYLEPTPFDIERDLVTPTFKLKRPQLLKYYQNQIDELYSEAKEPKV
ncbi:hypothetical protein Patl1_36299 [Pistacia atlantica]|nr:hypothetical protein Patl1_36299 [Pistacia atlantica]